MAGELAGLSGQLSVLLKKSESEEAPAAEAAGTDSPVQEVVPVAPEAPLPAEMEKSWKDIVQEMAGDAFAAVGFEQTGNEIAAAAAFEFRAKIASGAMTGEMFKAMMTEINGIAKSYEARLGRPEEQKMKWPQVADDMGRSNIAETAFERTGSRIVAAAGYRFRQGISKSQDEGASFKAMMREINQAVKKHNPRLPSG